MLVGEVEGTNQLFESCKIYLSSELLITELERLGYFNHFVTFPFQNCGEMSTQADLLLTLRKLQEDLKAKRVDTLSKFIVSIHGISTPTLSNDLICMIFLTLRKEQHISPQWLPVNWKTFEQIIL